MSQSEYSRSPQQHSRRRPIVALVVVVVLCLAAFSLGIFVGKQRQKIAQAVELDAPVTHQAASKPDAVAGEALVDQAKAPVGDMTTLTVGDETSDEAVVAARSVVESVAVVAPQQSSDPLAQLTTAIVKSPLGSGMNSTPVMAKVAAVSDSAVIPAVEKTTDAVVVPVTQKQTFASPASSVSSASGTVAYVVQVGSFKNRVDAEKLQLKLQKDYAVLVRNVDLGVKGVWFRVLVGTSSTKKAAVQLKEQLQSRYKMSGFVKKTTL